MFLGAAHEIKIEQHLQNGRAIYWTFEPVCAGHCGVEARTGACKPFWRFVVKPGQRAPSQGDRRGLVGWNPARRQVGGNLGLHAEEAGRPQPRDPKSVEHCNCCGDARAEGSQPTRTTTSTTLAKKARSDEKN